MSQVKFSRLISVSSEDQKHPANNLLKSDLTDCWKCKAGEKQAVIILQLEKSCVIDNITVGNENSAFIEILVGKSAVPDIYEVLRVASVLMTPIDVKNDQNRNNIRFFKHEEFSSPAVEQSWDRIKIICSQPFSRKAQYGLSFIKVHSKTIDKHENENLGFGKLTLKKGKSETAKDQENSLLGKFSLKKEETSKDSVTVGSFFARRNDLPDNMSAASSIKAAYNSLNGLVTSNTKRLSDVVKDYKNAKRPRINDDEQPVASRVNDSRKATTGRLLYLDDDSDDEIKSTESTPTRNKPTETTPTRNKPSTKKDSPATTKKLENKKSPKTPNRIKQNANDNNSPTSARVVKKKPFNRLLEGVVFVLSGFQNPYRSDLRSKALQLGAKYKADWDSTCTHLICAFGNTPKLQQVRGKGWVIRKDWIEDCHKLKKRLLASSYKLDKTDMYTNSDDEEIWEEREEDVKSILTDTTMEPERVKEEDDDDISIISVNPNTSKLTHVTNIHDVYNVDTDVDSDHSQTADDPNHETISMEVLPDFFDKKRFYLGTDLVLCVVNMLKRYIIAYKGDVLDDINEAHYIISGDTKYVENITNTPVILPDWIWECNDQKVLIPEHHYTLKL